MITRNADLSHIFHDLRNYIFGISGLAKMLSDTKISDQQRQLTQVIIEQSEEAMDFINDLLNTKQNETSQFTLDKITRCNISELVQKIILSNQNFANNSKVNITTNIDNNLPLFKCDVRRIKQILINLIINAIKYSPVNTEVKIAVKHLKSINQIYIKITDSGIGMSIDEIKMALNGNGRKIDKSDLNKPINSNGLGITIIKQLVELHKGKLEIESEKSKGTKVKLYFDVDNPKLVITESNKYPANTQSDIQPNTQFLSNKSVLIVDDNPVTALVITHILSNAGCKIYYVKNGKEALETLDNSPNIDLVLMDGEMPVMNGYDTAKTIRKGRCFTNFKNYNNIPIISLTGSNDEKTIKRTEECGMNRHISRNSVVELLDSITDIINANAR